MIACPRTNLGAGRQSIVSNLMLPVGMAPELKKSFKDVRMTTNSYEVRQIRLSLSSWAILDAVACREGYSTDEAIEKFVSDFCDGKRVVTLNVAGILSTNNGDIVISTHTVKKVPSMQHSRDLLIMAQPLSLKERLMVLLGRPIKRKVIDGNSVTAKSALQIDTTKGQNVE